MTPPARLLQLHGVIVDLIYRVEAVPAPGTEAQVHDFELTAGGGFNAMVAAKRSGLDVAYAGAIGTGPLGDVVRGALASQGIDHLRSCDPERDQGCCTVLIDREGERTFVASSGAEGHMTGADLQGLRLADFGLSLLSGYALYYEGSREALTEWLKAKPEIPNLVFDPAPIVASLRPDALEAAMAKASWVSANAQEAEVLTGLSDPLEAARQLAHGRDGAVVRRGSKGSVVAWGGQVQEVSRYPVAAVDTNGAGDTHVGAFIAALARGEGPAQAARIANVAAALSTTQFGPATAPDLATIQSALRLKEAS